MPKAETQFKPGNAGRPKGSKNRNYVDASFWLSLAYDVARETDDHEKRMAIIKWAVELIASRVPMIPSTPADSVANALAVQKAADEFVKNLEAQPVDAGTAPVSS